MLKSHKRLKVPYSTHHNWAGITSYQQDCFSQRMCNFIKLVDLILTY